MQLQLADARAAFLGGFMGGLLPDPPLWVDEWCQEHAYIPPEGNAEPGKYDLNRTPFARAVMRALSPGHPTNRVVVMGASQLLKTQSAMNWMMASVDGAAANILALMPTHNLALRLSTRINNTLKATPKVKDLFSAPRSREGKNTDDTKTFRGGSIFITTAGSAANLAEIPARYGYGDEIDDWEEDLQGQGDPIEIFENRGSTYGRNRKWYYSSSPKKPSEFSKIYALFLRGNQQHYHVPCPHCEHLHELVWEHMRWDEAITRAWMVCPECGAEIEEHSKGAMLLDKALGGLADWMPAALSSDGTESFTISQLYAPLGWASWLELARLYVQAENALREGDHTKMAAFYNTRLARCYDVATTVTSADKLQARAENYPPRVVPDAALVLTAYADTQPDRLEVQLHAWGPGMEHWLIDFIVLHGSPAVPVSDPCSVWARLDEIVLTPLIHTSGVPIKISAYGIDTGGSNTQDVYNYGWQRRHLNCVLTKGESRPNRPIVAAKPRPQDVDWGGVVRKDAIDLWYVGTDVAKDYVFNRIDLTAGPGAMHWHDQLPADWFEQMCAERPLTVTRGGQAVRVWRKLKEHARNEALDTTVGNVVLAHKLRLHTWSHADWQRLRDKLIPKGYMPGLFDAQPALPPADLSAVDSGLRNAKGTQTLADTAQSTPDSSTKESQDKTERTTAATNAVAAPPPVPVPAAIAAAAQPPVQRPRRRVFSRGIF